MSRDGYLPPGVEYKDIPGMDEDDVCPICEDPECEGDCDLDDRPDPDDDEL